MFLGFWGFEVWVFLGLLKAFGCFMMFLGFGVLGFGFVWGF